MINSNGFIYCIKNKINNKKYIGKTINIKQRYFYHFYLLNNNNHYNCHLQNSFNKYGENNFIFFIIEENIKENNLNKREEFWIRYFNTFKGEGYNLTRGGDGAPSGEDNPMYGKKLSKVHRDKISKAKKGKKLSEEHKDKIRKSKLGKSNPMFGKTGENYPLYNNENLEIIRKKNKLSNRNNSPLSYKDFYDIVKMYFEENIPQKEIANKYNCSYSLINNVINLKHWITEGLESR